MGSEQCLGILSSLLLLTAFLMVNTVCVCWYAWALAPEREREREGDMDADRWSGQLFSPLLLRFSCHLHWPFAPSPLGRDVVFSSLSAEIYHLHHLTTIDQSRSVDGWMDGSIDSDTTGAADDIELLSLLRRLFTYCRDFSHFLFIRLFFADHF